MWAVLNIYNIKDSPMKLQELDARKTTQKVTKVLESYFGHSTNFDRLGRRQAQHMLSRVRGLVREHRQTPDRHRSETDPAYLRLIMLEQALAARIQEQVPATTGTPVAGTDQNKMMQSAIDKVQDPKLKAALGKSAKGQPLNPEEEKMVAGAALMKSESRRRPIRESEVQQAQVVLAAQDMVDNIQGMIEDATEMQFKELPALVDSIRNQIGMEQAVQFQQDATAALTGLVQNLQGTKTSLEQGLGVVTGQGQMAPGLDAAMGGEPPPGAEAPIAPPADDEEEVDLSLDANLDEPEPAGGGLGRERR
jgi:hypothetical protein